MYLKKKKMKLIQEKHINKKTMPNYQNRSIETFQNCFRKAALGWLLGADYNTRGETVARLAIGET